MAAVKLTNDFDQAVASYQQSNASGKLTILWSVFTQLRLPVTTVVPAAELSQVVQTLIQQFNQVSRDEQIEVLKEIVGGADTRFGSEYSAFSINMKLAFWYRLSQGSNHSLLNMIQQNTADNPSMSATLSQIAAMDSNQHIYFLQCILDEKRPKKLPV